MNTDDIHGLTGAYAVDALDDVERARFEAHLAGCSQCQAEVASLSAAAGELAAGTLASPPASLRTAVLRDISAVRPWLPLVMSEEEADADPVAASASSAPLAPTSLDVKRAARDRHARPLRQWLAGAAAAAVLATGGLVWHPWSSGTSTVQLTAMQQVLQAKDAQRFETKVGGATATVVRSASLNRAVIAVANLPAPPVGKVYELWLQHGSAMVKAGFLPHDSSNTVLLQGDAATAAGAGITIEPAGGSPIPTLPPVALITFT
jgi:anti-sigma factor RsiW